ncbi:MAG: transposase [Myxococcota bacterium]|nr:transposase [Myxococcota bacterium]
MHAERAIDGRDRAQIERLCHYLTRPPLAQGRLERHDEHRYAFKRAWKDGTHAVVLEPLDLLARLAALVPPPRFHLLRYHGVLASNSAARAEVVPKRPAPKGQLPLFGAGEPGHLEPPAEPSRHPWAWLLRRVFRIEVSVCPSCGGRMRLVQIATEPADAARVLCELSLGARAPPPAARPFSPRQTSLPLAG